MISDGRKSDLKVRQSQKYFSDQSLLCNKNKSNRPNRYDRFRTFMLSVPKDALEHHPISINESQAVAKANVLDVAKHTMEVLASNRRSFNRTWKRMSPLLELIVLSCQDNEKAEKTPTISDGTTVQKGTSLQSTDRITTIADIGCDHGILSLSLACIAWVVSNQCNDNKENQSEVKDSNNFNFFSQVIGADVSTNALENGGLVSLQKMKETMMPISGYAFDTQIPIQFRVGNGLEPLQPGEADAVVLAGMGVHTMIDILLKKSDSSQGIAPLDSVLTQRVFLQPTNSRPQHMTMLYEALHASGWGLRDETVSYLGGRWYINCFWERDTSKVFHFPGHFLKDEIYDAYVKHHLQWLKKDYEQPGCLLADEDRRWLEYIQTSEANKNWRNLALWYH